MTLKRLVERDRVRVLGDLGGSVFVQVEANTPRRIDSATGAIVSAGGTIQKYGNDYVVGEIGKRKAQRLGLIAGGRRW